MDNERANAVLRVAEQLFQEEESHGHPAQLGNGPQLIGDALGLPPAEVLVLLRMLHRKGLIGLFGGIGLHVMIARDQTLLRPPTAVVTDGGKNAKLGKWPKIRTPGDTPEDEDRPETELLLDYINQLERVVDGLQERAEHTEKRRRNVVEARDRDKAAASAELERAQARIRELNDKVRTLQEEADKVPELERRLAESQEQRTMPKDLADRIARLTQGN